eukprot:3628329-Rhodomonas_salina.1
MRGFGTEIGYAATCLLCEVLVLRSGMLLRVRYAEFGTEIGYATTCSLCGVLVLRSAMRRRVCHASCGTYMQSGT